MQNFNEDFLTDILSQLKTQQKLVEIYHEYLGNNRFSVAYIVLVSNQHVLYECVSPEGRYDGFVVEPIDSISRINTDTLYTKTIGMLLSSNKINSIYDHQDFHMSDNQNLLNTLVEYSFAQQCCVSVSLLDGNTTEITGVITSVFPSGISMRIFDEYGNDDGLSYIRFSDIFKFTSDGIEEQKLKKLNDCT